MKLNLIERWFVNSPIRLLMQGFVIHWFRSVAPGWLAFERVLEIGCGRGAGGRMIETNFSPGNLFLMDLDEDMVYRATREQASRNERKIVYCVADATFLPFQDATMDSVFGFGFLHHVPDWRTGLLEVLRVLKPGGIYFFEEYYPTLYQNWLTKRLLDHPLYDRFSGAEFKEAFTDMGLQLQRTLELKRFGIVGIGMKSQ
jgi:ubiquinone/menaquinone biosynthesis C-methylase UbiE